MEAIVADDFKPNSALIVLDFLIRHGIVNTENGNKQILLIWFIVTPVLKARPITHNISVQKSTSLLQWRCSLKDEFLWPDSQFLAWVWKLIFFQKDFFNIKTNTWN